jgi:hypothetical protein
VRREEIERGYLGFESGRKLASDFGLSESSISRHATYFNLDQRRVANTEKLLQTVIARGFSQVKKIDGRLFLEAIKELNKITGKHKEPAKNPETTAREAYTSLVAEFADIPAEVIAERVARKYGVSESALIN